MSNLDRSIRHARQRYALAISHRADAKSLKAERKADRRAAAARRAWLAELRAYDMAEA